VVGPVFSRRLSGIFSILLILSLLFIFDITPVSANTIVVDTLEDQDDTDPEHCSLREAIEAANGDIAYGGCPAGSGADIISLGSGIYTVVSQVHSISTNISIIGVSPSSTIIQASECNPTQETCANDDQFAWVSTAGILTLNNLTIRNWKNTGDLNGGFIHNRGTLNVSNCLFDSNRAVYGGAINNFGGSVTITDSTFTSNMAHNGSGYTRGGAIFNDISGPGTVTIYKSTFSDNSAELGGAIINNGILAIVNSTFSDNSATISGGAIYNDNNTATITNTTFSGNSAVTNGAGIFNDDPGVLNFTNTIIANSVTGSDCFYDHGTIGTNVNNLVEDGSCNADFSGDPALGPLADNGGSTQTHALLSGSIAIDTANLAACPHIDQRGVERPQGEGCDIGAFEKEPFDFLFLPLILKQ
jgi:CSLREA domain-containing protein